MMTLRGLIANRRVRREARREDRPRQTAMRERVAHPSAHVRALIEHKRREARPPVYGAKKLIADLITMQDGSIADAINLLDESDPEQADIIAQFDDYTGEYYIERTYAPNADAIAARLYFDGK